jgi:polyisoprenoid-binding protein YceI
MLSLRILCFTALLLISSSAARAAEPYVLDPVHSSTEFSVRHMMLSNVKGRFKELSGQVLFDEQDIKKSSVSVVIKTASISTGEEARDNHLRSPDFFDAQKYPEITFKSQRVEEGNGALVCLGTLTIRGVSREVAIPFTFVGKVKDPAGKTRIGFEGNLTINRQDYGVSWSKTLDNGGVVVGDEVKISLAVEAVKQ